LKPSEATRGCNLVPSIAVPAASSAAVKLAEHIAGPVADGRIDGDLVNLRIEPGCQRETGPRIRGAYLRVQQKLRYPSAHVRVRRRRRRIEFDFVDPPRRWTHGRDGVLGMRRQHDRRRRDGRDKACQAQHHAHRTPAGPVLGVANKASRRRRVRNRERECNVNRALGSIRGATLAAAVVMASAALRGGGVVYTSDIADFRHLQRGPVPNWALIPV
jgi:hypothetical protein